MHAASQWPETEFVGFDLVNIQVPTRYLESSLSRRITWQHGNLCVAHNVLGLRLIYDNSLSQRLPFEAGTFDFVRCVNIGRAVPETKVRDRGSHVGGSSAVDIFQWTAIFQVTQLLHATCTSSI